MNRYSVIAQQHWARWLPRQYAAISDPKSFFTTLRQKLGWGGLADRDNQT